MKTILNLLISALVFIGLFISCNNNRSPGPDIWPKPSHEIDTVKLYDSSTITAGFKTSLIEKKLPHTYLYISLPPGYTIKTKEFPDQEFYYFIPEDTTSKPDFSCGIFLGNTEQDFKPTNDSCKTSPIASRVLDKTTHWAIYNCNGEYSMQTRVGAKRKMEWFEKVHAFGHARSEADISKVIYIFSTLRQL